MGIAHNVRLEKLDISANTIGDSAGAAILEALVENRSLKEINLSANNLGVIKTVARLSIFELLEIHCCRSFGPSPEELYAALIYTKKQSDRGKFWQ